MRRVVTNHTQADDIRVVAYNPEDDGYQYNPDANHEYDPDSGEEVPDISDPWVRKTRTPSQISYWEKYNQDHPTPDPAPKAKIGAVAPPMSEDNLDNIPEDPEYWEEFNRKRRTSARSIKPSSRKDWRADPVIDGFKTSKLDAVFSCNCGTKFSPTGMYRCACGQSWASFVTGSSNDKEAGKELRIVRPVNEFRDRVLADRRTASRRIVGDGLPIFVRNASENDSAPTILDEAEPRKTAAGGFGDIATPGFAPNNDQLATTEPASAPVAAPVAPATTPPRPTTLVPPVTPPVLPVVNRAPTRVTTPPVTSTKKETMKMATTVFDEDAYRLGWVLASSDSPLPKEKLSQSFLGGYADCLSQVIGKTADYAPDLGAVDKCFAGPSDGVGDTMDHSKNIIDPTQVVRKELGDKIDQDNAEGQGRSDETMNDLSGWKTSALLKELNRRTKI